MPGGGRTILMVAVTCGGMAVAASAQAPVHDECATAIPITEGTTAFSTQGASTSLVPIPPGVGDCDSHGDPSIYHDVWYTITAQCDGYLHVTTCYEQTIFDTKVAIYEGTCSDLTILACSDGTTGCGILSFAYAPVTSGESYTIRIGSGQPNQSGSGLVEVTCADTTPDGPPEEVGRWLAPEPWPVIAIHAAVLSTGKVLHWAFPGGGAAVWDPVGGGFEPTGKIDQNIFCSSMSFLPDGRLYVAGGSGPGCENAGIRATHVFDPLTRDWTSPGDMLDARWYPTSLTLGSGQVMILSGRNTQCEINSAMEVFTPGSGLSVVPGGERTLSLYPRVHLLSSGKIAHVGVEPFTTTFDPGQQQWEEVALTKLERTRGSGTSVLLPGAADQIMLIGGRLGDDGVTGTCEIIDFSRPSPQWRWTGSLNLPRAHTDSLILPDRTVMIVGGGTEGLFGAPIRVPELFDPQTETWRTLPPHVFARSYHSTTVLLPDGRVLSAGQNFGPSATWGEIYEPAYLFRGRRPRITTAPDRIGYGLPFTIRADAGDAIASMALIAPSTVTHSVNNSQRYVDLEFEPLGDGELRVTGPPSPNHAPAGNYMLFILNEDDVPSVAEFVQVLPAAPGDLDGNGVVDISDLVVLILSWGPCPGCPADIDGNGLVDIQDLSGLILNWG